MRAALESRQELDRSASSRDAGASCRVKIVSMLNSQSMLVLTTLCSQQAMSRENSKRETRQS